MSDFVVTINGKYLYSGLLERMEHILEEHLFLELELDDIIEDAEFDHLDYSYTFNEQTGRVSSAGRYFALYSSRTGKCTGYVNAKEFWTHAEINKKGNNYAIPPGFSKDLRLFRSFKDVNAVVPKLDLFAPELGDRIFLLKRYAKPNEDGGYQISITLKVFTYPDEDHPSYETIKDGLDYVVVDKIDESTHVFDNTDILPNFQIMKNITILYLLKKPISAITFQE